MRNRLDDVQRRAVWEESEYVLELEKVTVELEGFALKDINLRLPRGAVVGLIGRNGSGKTTLIKTIVDMCEITEGRILYGGLEMDRNEVFIKNRLGVVLDRFIYPEKIEIKKLISKVLESFYDDFDRQRFEDILYRFDLPREGKPINFSKGMQMKLMLATVLARDADLVILDEPTAGLDAVAREELLDMLQEYMENEKKTVVFSTHITTDLDKISDYIVMIDGGRVLFMDDKESLMDRYAIVKVEKSALTEEIEECLIGARRGAFGVTALTAKTEALRGRSGVVLSRPTIEDFIVYGGGGGEDAKANSSGDKPSID